METAGWKRQGGNGRVVSIYYIYFIYKKKPGKKKNKNEKRVSRETMKNLIDSLGITHRRFAELYGIPYRTVAAWYTGERTAPEWVKSLIMQNIELKKNGEQISIEYGKKYYLHYTNDELAWVYDDIKIAKRWHSLYNDVCKVKKSEIKEITIKEEKTIMYTENLKKTPD